MRAVPYTPQARGGLGQSRGPRHCRRLPRARLSLRPVHLPLIRMPQERTWDCGLACLAMIFDALDIVGALPPEPEPRRVATAPMAAGGGAAALAPAPRPLFGGPLRSRSLERLHEAAGTDSVWSVDLLTLAVDRLKGGEGGVAAGCGAGNGADAGFESTADAVLVTRRARVAVDEYAGVDFYSRSLLADAERVAARLARPDVARRVDERPFDERPFDEKSFDERFTTNARGPNPSTSAPPETGALAAAVPRAPPPALSSQELLALAASGRCLMVLLVDKGQLGGGVGGGASADQGGGPENPGGFSPYRPLTGYCGHYVVVAGARPSAGDPGGWEYALIDPEPDRRAGGVDEPAATRGAHSNPPDATPRWTPAVDVDRARLAFGTDEDLLVVSLPRHCWPGG